VGAVDEALAQVDLADVAQVFREPAKHLSHRAVFHPALVATERRRVRAVARGEIGPRCARTKNPQHAVHHLARRPPWPTTLLPWRLQLFWWKTLLEVLPLLVGEIHLSGWITLRDRRRSPFEARPPRGVSAAWCARSRSIAPFGHSDVPCACSRILSALRARQRAPSGGAPCALSTTSALLSPAMRL
jgi:hypothetical protein